TRRYFSIASSPTEKDVKLTTKFADESSTYKNKLKDLNRDEVILAGSLDGDFVLPNKLDKGLVFIAGGVGIAPFRSMIKYIIDNNLKADITLFYSNKDYDEIGFTDLFDEAEEKIGLKTVYVLTGKTPPNWSGRRGFITDKMISEEVPDHANKIYYISGPDPMVRSYVKLLKNMGISPGQIKTDYFPGYE
ncbi:MAG TPA: FAD-dependent oxidoreductase, partial [Verrucomicrobiae bacterium]|nr:FAD-dependent oxidoreductase [Verrucomicrobiae bacterium]